MGGRRNPTMRDLSQRKRENRLTKWSKYATISVSQILEAPPPGVIRWFREGAIYELT
jgi:hypothetical protein